MKQLFPLDSIRLEPGASEPLHRQLYWALRKMIENAQLAPGFELPSTRTMAADLAVARNTVVTAYDQLIAEGFLVGRQSARSVVIDLPRRSADRASPKSTPVLSRRGEFLAAQRIHHGAPKQFAFHPGMPDSHIFPYREWARLLSLRTVRDGERLFGTYSVTGLDDLRLALVSYLRGARGVNCAPEQVIVTTGAQGAFDLLARLLIDPGDDVWMEEPGYYGAHSVFESAGATLRPLPVGPSGWTLEPPKGARLRIIFVTPACQHPFGVTMGIDQRLRLLDIAERHNAWVIEDDYDGEYRFDGRPAPSLQGVDQQNRVVYVGTLAKIMFPALRLGYAVVPEPLITKLPNALSTTGQFAPLILQAALADFINSGMMGRHLRRTRRLYAQRRAFFLEQCNAVLGDLVEIKSCGAGIQIPGFLRSEVDDVLVAQKAARLGLNISPLSKYFRGAPAQQGMVLGYAACDEPAIARGLTLLKRTLI